MAFRAVELAQAVAESEDLECQLAYDESGITVWPAGRRGDLDAPKFVVLDLEGDWRMVQHFWSLRYDRGTVDSQVSELLEMIRERFMNHGRAVPVVLRGGPRSGECLELQRESLEGLQLLPIDGGGADVYVWDLSQDPQGAYVCIHDRTEDRQGLGNLVRQRPPVPFQYLPQQRREVRTIDVFDREPYLRLGPEFLQAQCDSWLETEQATAAGVTKLTVGGGANGVGIRELAIRRPRGAAPRGLHVPFPMEHLLNHVLEASPLPEPEKDAERRHLRQFWARHPQVFRRFMVS